MLHYKDSYHGKKGLYVDFIAYKGGQTIELNKRTTEHKNLLEKASTLAIRAKKPTDEESLFEIISRLESASYNEQLAFLAEEQQEDPQLRLLDLDEMQSEPEAEQPEEPIDQATITSIEPLSTETEENTDVVEPAQEITQEQEVIPETQPEKTGKRGKLRVVKDQEIETNAEPASEEQ